MNPPTADDRAGLIKAEVQRSDGAGGEFVHATAVSSSTLSSAPTVQGYAVQGTVAEPRPSAGMVVGGGPRAPHIYTQQPGVPIIIYAQDPAASNAHSYPLPPAVPPHYPGTGAGAGPPMGYWRDGICDCCRYVFRGGVSYGLWVMGYGWMTHISLF